MNLLPHPLASGLLVSLFALAMALPGHAQNDPQNPTSNNNEITAVPAPGPVVIDGKDDDWDLSGGIWSYNDPTLVEKYSVWTHLMWDQKGVYLLMRYADPTPMRNATRGVDFENSWRADAFQGRVILDDRTPEEHQMHINQFYSSTEQRPYMIVHHGGFKSKPPYDNTGPARPDQLEKFGVNMEQAGGKVAFHEWDDGKGYNMECFWPWTYLRTSGQPLEAGDSFIFGVEAMWGDAEGTKVIHRLVDNMKNDLVNRIFFFRARDGWGRVVLGNKNDISSTENQRELQATRLKLFVDYDTVGPVDITYDLPDNRDVTIAIDNAKGERVRNLFGQFPRTKGTNVDHWDGLDDNGTPLSPGTYTATIVDHDPIEVKFLNSVYNAATPPWATDTGRLLWGSNHGHPTTVATRGEVTLIGFTGTEGAPGIIRIEPDGHILWTNNTELYDIAITDQCAYLLSRESWTRQTLIRRLDINTGKIVLFDNTERSTEIILPVPIAEVSEATIAYADGKIFGFVPGKSIWRVDPDSGAIEATLSPPAGLVAIDNQKDLLFGLFADGTVARLDDQARRGASVMTARGLTKPTRFAFNNDGSHIAISDAGSNQVFLFDAHSGALAHTIGRPYSTNNGERLPGKFVNTDLIRPLGLDFDAQGRLWLAEAAKTCRRITRWSPTGDFENQFWGGADYGAMAGFPLTFDSTRFIAHGVEFKLDPSPDIMHRPTAEVPLAFHPALSTERGMVYKYRDHEYAVTVPGYNKQTHIIIAKRNTAGVFTPVVRIDYPVSRGKHASPGKVWTDLNENGVVDPGETVEGFQGRTHYWSNGWVRPDLTLITPDQLVYPLKSLTAGGVPIYDFTHPETLPNHFTPDFTSNRSGTIAIDAAGNISDGIHYATVDGRTGSYPNPYSRHDAPAARRGLLIAPFRTNGVVEGVPGVGSITAISGDRGEWFLMSMDGLYLSSILQDSKGDVTLDHTYVGQESFGGFIWRDEKGRVLAQLGAASYRIVEITGLDTVRKSTQPINLTAAQVSAGVELAESRLADRPQEPEALVVNRIRKMPSEPIAADTRSADALIAGGATFRVQEEGDPSRWFRASLVHNGRDLAIMWQVNDANPWKNSEGRFTHAFIGGDAVDLQLDIPDRGPVRLLAAPLNGKNTAVYWQRTAAQKDNATTYVVSNNPGNAQSFDIVKRLDTAKLSVNVGQFGYAVLMTVPLADLGIKPTEVDQLKGIIGVIYSDPSGTDRASRLYWHDKATGLVSDVPSEAAINPAKWGQINLGK